MITAVVLAILMAVTKNLAFVVLALAAMLAEIIVRLRYWRCPHCGKFLGEKLGPQHCHYCGEKIEL